MRRLATLVREVREVREETGAVVREVVAAFGEVVTCRVHDELGAQTLDDYERDLRLTPVWLETDAALERLRAVAASTWRRSPRDLLALEHLVAEQP